MHEAFVWLNDNILLEPNLDNIKKGRKKSKDDKFVAKKKMEYLTNEERNYYPLDDDAWLLPEGVPP